MISRTCFFSFNFEETEVVFTFETFAWDAVEDS